MTNKALHKDLKQIEIEKTLLAKKSVQKKIKSKYDYLHKVDNKHFKYEFLKAQAEKICEMDLELRLGPFKSLYTNILATFSDRLFLEAHFVKFNKYGILEVDYEALQKFKPITINFSNINKKVH